MFQIVGKIRLVDARRRAHDVLGHGAAAQCRVPASVGAIVRKLLDDDGEDDAAQKKNTCELATITHAPTAATTTMMRRRKR